jgi:predicted metalloprotease
VDVLRTLAHELTHHKQNQAGILDSHSGATGTEEENQANANAGIVMRDFAKQNPEYFGLDK